MGRAKTEASFATSYSLFEFGTVGMFQLCKGFPEAPLSGSVVSSFPQACEAAHVCRGRRTLLGFGAREQLSPLTKGAGLALLEWLLGVLRSIVHVSLLPSAPQEHVLLLGGRWFVVAEEADGAREHLAGQGCGTPPWASAVRRRGGGAFAGTSLEAVSAELGPGLWRLSACISCLSSRVV